MITDDEVPKTAKWLRSLPVEERMRQLRIPPLYADAWMLSVRDPERIEVQAVRDFVDGFGQDPRFLRGTGLTLIGPGGSGKSWLAAAALRHLVQHNRLSGGFVSSRTYLRMVTSQDMIEAGFQDPHSALYLRDRLDVVVLDGLGQERWTPQSNSFMYELLRDRSDKNLTTIITTSLPMDGLRERYGADMADFIERQNLEVPVGGQ